MSNSWRGNSDVPLAADNRILYASGWFYRPESRPAHISHGGQNPNFLLALRCDGSADWHCCAGKYEFESDTTALRGYR